MSSALYAPKARPSPSLGLFPSPAWPMPTPAAPLPCALCAVFWGGRVQEQLGTPAEPGEVGGKAPFGSLACA